MTGQRHGKGAPSRDIAGLADLLIARHVRISVPDSIVRDRLAEVHDPKAYPVETVERHMHCIAVVGAGASVPLLDRADDLATKLEKEFGRDEGELDRLQLVNNLERDAFETRLIALSRSPHAADKVRQTISEKYNIRHPTLLGYELLAHLLKHRFVDAIVSFNFDELLDQSLDDELDAGEYRRVVSERDCAAIQPDPSAPDYVPLYVKLHGTATEPESLRFTPDSYYAIPRRISQVVKELLRAEQCVIVNVGAGLGSFDFQRLLGIPRGLDVFNLSLKAVPDLVVRKIDAERPRDRPGSWLHECNGADHGCDELLDQLTSTLAAKAEDSPGLRQIGDIVQFRSVRRHEAVSHLLGSDMVDGRGAGAGWSTQNKIDYLRRRTILELAFAGAKARGLMSLGPLALDRPARYFDEYRRVTKGRGEDWSAMCSAAGLIESDQVPDILVSLPSLRKDREVGDDARAHDETRMLHEFEPRKLATHVLARVRNPLADGDEDLLATTIAGLQEQADVELHMRDDRVCSKAFKRPITLATTTSLEVYTWLMLRDIEPDDAIYISSETGAWLLRDATRAMLGEQQKLHVLLAFDIEEQALAEAYGDRLALAVIDPWRHNRHMTIVCKGGRPTRAIYFARRLRTPVITAVYLDSIRDVQRLMKTFQMRWEEANEERPGSGALR